MSEAAAVDAVIVGGGIAGLMTAWKFLRAHPGSSVIVLEKERYLGEHSTGRNSGVLHAGIYYPTGSLKHRFCLEGREEWLEIAKALDIPHRICGKYIFAANEAERADLARLFETAKTNDVPGIRTASKAEIEKLSAYVRAEEALYSPESGILDVSEALIRLRSAFEGDGGMVLTECRVTGVERESEGFRIETDRDAIRTRILVNCAGLFACGLREMLGLKDLVPWYVKGNYLKTSQRLGHPCLLYPVPLKQLKGLGVHSTLDLQGEIKFGPNTEDVAGISYDMGDGAFEAMVPEIERRFVGIDRSKLRLDYCGIRSKIRRAESGEVHTDFWIQGPKTLSIPGYVEACGIESPGLTASPRIATELLRLIAE